MVNFCYEICVWYAQIKMKCALELIFLDLEIWCAVKLLT